MNQPAPWECPRCRVVNAWWVSRCNCKPSVKRGRPTRYKVVGGVAFPLPPRRADLRG